MGRCNNRRAQERAAQERNVPSRARFSKGPPKKNGRGGGRGGRGGRGGGRGDGDGRDNNYGGRGGGGGRGGRGGGGGRGGRGRGGRTPTNDAVVQKIQNRVARQSQDIGGISVVSKRKRKSNPLAGVDVSKLDTVALSAESVKVVERLLKAYNVWEEAESDNDDDNDSIEEKKNDNDDDIVKLQPAQNLTCDALPTLKAGEEDLYDDYYGDYDDEPSEQCQSQEFTNRGEDIMYDSNSDQGDNGKEEGGDTDEFSDTPSFLHLTQHYSFRQQDVILALSASTKRIRLSKKDNEVNDKSVDHESKSNNSAKEDGIILEMTMDWLSLHLNESDLRHGFRVQSKPKSGATSSHDRMMANTIPMKFKAVPHESISIMPKLTQSQYEKESREASLEWKRQQLTTELIRTGFHSLEIESVFASLEDEMEMMLDKIPESNYDEDGNELQLISQLDDKIFTKLVECIEMEVGSESIDSTGIDEEIDEMATMERDQEKEVLEAIYAESFQSLYNDERVDENRYLLQVNPTTPLQPPAQNDKCYLHVLTRRGYPLVQTPIVWFFNGSLPPSLLRRMNTLLITKSREQLGQATVYELMEYLSEHLSLWQKEFIDEEASVEKAAAAANDEAAAKTEEASDDDEIDYFTTTFTAEERKKLSRRQRQKLIAAEKLYARDEIILEKQRLKQQNDEERRKRIQFENKTISSRMADKEVNKRWHKYVHDEAEKASRKAMNDAFLKGDGREEARAAADSARLEVLRFHGELEENCNDENDQSNVAESSPLVDDTKNIEVKSDGAEEKVVDASVPLHTPKSEATPKTLLFVEKLRKMYGQKVKEKAEGVDSTESDYGTVRLTSPSSTSNDPMKHAPTPVVAPSPGVEEVIDDIVQTQKMQPWLIAPDARVPVSSEKSELPSQTVSIEEAQKKEKMTKSLRADLKRKYDKRSGPFNDILSQRAKLPAYKMKDEIVRTIVKSQVTVVSGDTGCGKTTQLPQLVLDDMIQHNMGADANIIVTQPRRISAIGVADRVASERLEKVGQTVGYSIRLDSKRSSKTRLLLCTTGVLLRRLQVDPDLASVSHVFVDEVHERDLNTDFLLIILRDLLQRRKSLKLVLMSATLNAERFSDYFGGAPIITIPGRAQPVKEYRLEDALEVTGHIILEESEYAAKKSREDNNSGRMSKTALRRLYPNYGKNVISSLANVDESITNYELIGDLIEYICNLEEDGAILVFLSGLGEIKSAMEEISKREGLSDNTVIFPLHSSLSNAEQTAIFQRPPKGKRKIVLSSNIAETSITIDDVVFVIDSGRVKENRYDDLNKMPTLMECWVSKASARQRKGRAGRVKPGYCWHLYSTHTHDNVLDDYQLPEMLRVGLEDLILQILILDLGSPPAFLAKAVNPPTELSVKNALQLLESLGAAEIDWDADSGDETSELVAPASLTALGYHLAALPVHARVGKMMIYGSLFGVFDPCLTIAAAMTCRNPFISSFDNRDAADDAKKSFAADDHLAVLLAFHQWRELKRSDGRTSRAFLRENYLSYQSLSNIVQLRNQLKRYMKDIGFVASSLEKDSIGSNELSLIRAVISAAMYPNVIVAPKKISTTAGEVAFRGQKGEVYLHPSTIAFSAKELDSRYCCYHEIMKTSKVYVRDCTTISKFSLLLFGGALKVYQSKGVVAVDDWLKFRCDAKPATLVKYLRQSMEALLLEKIMDPSIDIAGTVKGRAVIDSVTSLLKMETK